MVFQNITFVKPDVFFLACIHCYMENLNVYISEPKEVNYKNKYCKMLHSSNWELREIVPNVIQYHVNGACSNNSDIVCMSGSEWHTRGETGRSSWGL
jgi:hypothetical protein